MFEFFDQILGFILVVWQFLHNIITGLLTAIDMLEVAVGLPPLLVGFMPTVIGASMMIFVSIFVIKFIIGR